MRVSILGSIVVLYRCVSWFFNVYIDAVMKELKMGMGRRGGEI